jgi:predicted RNA-binding Zn ribbon-like protein
MSSPVLLLPEEPMPVRLMNTIWADRAGVHDALTTSAHLRAWLTDTGLTPARTRLQDTDLGRARTLRDALRRLAWTVVGDDRPAAASALGDIDQAVAGVNRATTATRSVPVLERRGTSLRHVVHSSGTPAAAALTEVALEAIGLLTVLPSSLRACNAPSCVLYFVQDHPRREWCSPACGNRARAARHYRRHHQAAR